MGLRDCTLEVPAGAVAAVVGPNGAGKTTLLEMIIGLLEPTEGQVSVFGQPSHADTAESLVAERGVAPAGGGQREDQSAGRLGQHDGLAAEPDAHLAVCGLDVAEGEAADRRGSLGVEQDE